MIFKVMKFVVLAIFIVFTCSCTAKTPTQEKGSEIVLKPGMSITGFNSLGKLTITADTILRRTFTWNNDSRSLVMIPREKRWYGSLGIYFPGAGPHWKEHDGITRAVVDEGILNFKSIDEILDYVGRYRDKDKYSYTDDGLFLIWKKSQGAGGTLVVQLWQFLVNQTKPTYIPGSDNSKIVLNP